MNTSNTSPDTRSTRIAVFIDFDNVEIGVKSTIGGQFDIGLVLEAIKERGEIVTKIAYSDWQKAGDYSRLLTQHAIRMVQRNLTPGGDKNGADITMALDALEMAFTHDHINAFVIVGGDSDFISLVEKLKQYGRKVIVVGGRQFTSQTMQRNCHEFIAYENLVGSRGGGRSSDRGKPAATTGDIAKVLPLVKRALKVLSEREVAPQLGLLKSTLLQLDSTFSEREYGTGSFRDFMEKVARTGAVTLKHAGRSMMVESNEGGDADEGGFGGTAGVAAGRSRAERTPVASKPAGSEAGGDGSTSWPSDAQPQESRQADDADEEESLPASPMSMQDGIKAVQQAFSQGSPRWPMYVRQAKQYLRTAIEGFDERKYGFASVVDLLRAAGKENVLKIERDRQGAVRIFAGPRLSAGPAPSAGLPLVEEGAEPVIDAQTDAASESVPVGVVMETVIESPIVDGEVDGETGDIEDDVNGNVEGANVSAPVIAPSAKRGARKRPVASRTAKGPKAAKSPRSGARKTGRTRA